MFRIEYLDEHTEAIPQLARWHHAEWLDVTPTLTVDDRIAGFVQRAQRGRIPTGVVAVIDGAVVGMACLVACDVDSHAHLTPWLATVLVAPGHRGKGVGTALSRRATEEASAIGVANLYLFTFDKQRFYARLGWVLLDTASYAHRPGTIITLTLCG